MVNHICKQHWLPSDPMLKYSGKCNHLATVAVHASGSVRIEWICEQHAYSLSKLIGETNNLVERIVNRD